MSGININDITVFAMQLYPDSETTKEAVFRLLCDTSIAYLNEYDLLRPTSSPKPHPRLTIASVLDSAKETVFALIDEVESGS